MPHPRSIIRFIVLLSLVFGMCTMPQKQKSPPVFSFIFCNDLHVSNPLQARNVGEYVSEWNALSDQFDFVVVAGDLVEHGTPDELSLCTLQLDKLKKPWYPVIGNHDIGNDSAAGKSAWRYAFGNNRENYAIVHKGFRLLFLDLSNGANAHTTVPEPTVAWLKKECSIGPSAGPIIVFSHFPLHPLSPDFAVEEPERLFSILDTLPVLACFSGHWHGPWSHARNAVWFYGSAPLSADAPLHDKTRNRGYLWVDVFPDTVKVTFCRKRQIPGRTQ